VCAYLEYIARRDLFIEYRHNEGVVLHFGPFGDDGDDERPMPTTIA